MSFDVDCIVAGAGVVGLACARALAEHELDVLVLEKEDVIGSGVSSRNSEVIHAGIYYEPGSLKARLCVAGKTALYAYCEARGVEHQRIGKLIVATQPSESAALQQLQKVASANGVTLTRLTAAEAVRLEPELRCTEALYSESTGIVDSHQLMLSLQGDAENLGVVFVFRSPVVSGHLKDGGGFNINVGGNNPTMISCRYFINSTGLHAATLARSFDGLPVSSIPPSFYCKGSYFSLATSAPFKHLIYPVPSQAGLGVHYTLDLGGRARFGPDVEWVTELKYEVDERRGSLFEEAVRSYWPGLPENSLHPDYSGIRPKIVGPEESAGDFVISGPGEHGVAGLVNLYGIESPGLTACLALADEVRDRVLERA